MRRRGELKSARNYLMKYIAKGLTNDGETDALTLQDSDMVRHDIRDTDDFAPGQHFLVFNTILWHCSRHGSEEKGIRSFQPSRLLSRIMHGVIEINPFIFWYSVDFYYWGNIIILSDKINELNIRTQLREAACADTELA